MEKLIKSTGVTAEQLDQECDDAILKDIADQIVEYQRYGSKLGLSETDIKACRLSPDADGNIKLITAKVFQMWHKEKGDDATYRALANVALKLRDGTGAKIICQICKEGNIPSMIIPAGWYKYYCTTLLHRSTLYTV